MQFNTQERVKRIKMTQDLRNKGWSIVQLAAYFGVKQETVSEYLREMDGLEAGQGGVVIASEKKKQDLFSFAEKTVDSSSFFVDTPLSEGFNCVVCKLYRKFEAGKQWKENVYVCHGCFPLLTSDDIARFDAKF